MACALVEHDGAHSSSRVATANGRER